MFRYLSLFALQLNNLWVFCMTMDKDSTTPSLRNVNARVVYYRWRENHCILSCSRTSIQKHRVKPHYKHSQARIAVPKGWNHDISPPSCYYRCSLIPLLTLQNSCFISQFTHVNHKMTVLKIGQAVYLTNITRCTDVYHMTI